MPTKPDRSLKTAFDDADALKAMREALGLSQERFAELIGMQRQQLSAYENRRHTAGVRHLAEIAARAGCRLQILIYPPETPHCLGSDLEPKTRFEADL